MADLEFRMLGPLEVLRQGVVLPLSPGRSRLLLALLLVHGNEVVPTDRLLEELWRGQPPPSAPQAVQVYVSNLRKLLEPERPPGGPARVLVTRQPGYVLEVLPERCDARRFEVLVSEGGKAADDHRWADATLILDQALALWRGTVLADLGDEPFVQAEAVRLGDLQLVATERRIEAQLALGCHRELVSELEALIRQYPFREQLWARLMVALYRSGRQADALRAFQRLRRVLGEELGLEPSPELRLLEAAVLRHDPELALPAPPAPDAPVLGGEGLSAPLAASVEARERRTTSSPPFPNLLTDTGPIFVGRDRELERLEGLWKEAEGGELRMALLAGEPGVGKTRLAAEFAARVHARGATVLAGRCDEDLEVPYQPFVEALRQFVDHTATAELAAGLGRFGDELVRLVPELADRLPGLPPPLRSDPDTERYRLFDAVAAWLATVSAHAPLLFVLDDLQWAAKPTLLLLRHVARSRESTQTLLLGIFRDTELVEDHPLVDVLADLRRQAGVARLSLTGLDASGVAAFVEEASSRGLDADAAMLARTIHQETDGNPFFVREVLRHLAETGAVERGGDASATRVLLEELGIPEGVREVVATRLGRLSGETNRVLRTAAVVGTEFEPAWLAAGDVDEEGLISALEEAAAARLVIEGAEDRYRFAHAIVRDTLYAGLSGLRRATLHRQVGEAIETIAAARIDDYLPALAHHFARAGDAPKAVEYAARAGDRAMAQLAFEAAAAHYEQALADIERLAGDSSSQRGALLWALGNARARGGDPRAGDAYRSAAELARTTGDAEVLAGAALGLADLWGFTGTVDDTRIGLLEEAREALGGSTSAITARLLARLATELFFVPGSWDRREVLSAESVDVARRLGDPLTLALSLHARNYAMWAPGGAGDRLALGREIVDVAQQGGDAELALHGHAWCQTALLELGDVAGLDAELAAYDRLADQLRQPRYRWYAATRRAMRALLAGDLDEGERLARAARELGKDAGEADAENVFGAQMFHVWQERPSQEAIDHSHARCQTAEATVAGDSPLVVGLRLMWLLLLLDTTHRTEEARAELNRLLGFSVERLDATFYGMGWSVLAVLLTTAAVRLSARDAAASLYDLLLPHADSNAQDCGAVTFLGAYSHHLGMLAATLAQWDRAEQHLAAAAEAHERMGARAYLARTRLEWAVMLLTRRGPGDVERARKLLDQVLTAARELGLASVERRAVELLT